MEFTVSSQNLKGNFQWNTDFNISFNRNKLTKLGLNKVYYYAEMYESKEKAVILKEGLPLGTFLDIYQKASIRKLEILSIVT